VPKGRPGFNNGFPDLLINITDELAPYRDCSHTTVLRRLKALASQGLVEMKIFKVRLDVVRPARH